MRTWINSEGMTAKLVPIASPSPEICRMKTTTLTAMMPIVTHW